MDVTVFSRDGCPFCVKVKQDLRNAGVAFEELALGRDYTEQTLRAVANATTVPQVFLSGQHIGGSEAVDAAAVWRRGGAASRREQPAPGGLRAPLVAKVGLTEPEAQARHGGGLNLYPARFIPGAAPSTPMGHARR